MSCEFDVSVEKKSDVNPCCVAGDMVVQTSLGPRTVRSVESSTSPSKISMRPKVQVFQLGIKPVLLIMTKSGRTVKTTANHHFLAQVVRRHTVAEFSSLLLYYVRETRELKIETVRIADGSELVEIRSGHWIPLEKLYVGALLYMSNGNLEEIASIEPYGEEQVYSVIVAGTHEFDGNCFRMYSAAM